MTARDQIAQHAAAFGQHALNALFLGFLPVFLIAGILYVMLRIVRPEPAFSAVGFMFALVGATVGILLGTSREPVVQAIVPAILTVITGYLGWTLRNAAHDVHTAISLFGTTRAQDGDDMRFVTSLVFCAVSALMLSTISGSMWGASMRHKADAFDRAYERSLIEFTEIEVPLNAEVLRRDLGLSTTDAD